ncbi:MAG: hypothetical protein IJP23_07080 [Oscillospiraceae bacterium]|nr:hypothetical protein [Oscillospiraceae bacterium]
MNFFRRLFYGRYGGDKFNTFLCAVTIIVYFVFFFTGVKLVLIAAALLYAYVLMRMFSKNIPARQRELHWYMKKRQKVVNLFRGSRARAQDTTHKYFRCRKCGRTLRVPKGKGKINIKCPCGNTITKKT